VNKLNRKTKGGLYGSVRNTLLTTGHHYYKYISNQEYAESTNSAQAEMSTKTKSDPGLESGLPDYS